MQTESTRLHRLTNAVCEQCDGPYYRPPSQSSTRRFCSQDCFRAYLHRPDIIGARFWAKVDKNGPIPPHCPELGPCWLWNGSIGKWGYGNFSPGNGVRVVSAHRYAWEQLRGPIPEGLHLLHHCDVKRCVNAEQHHFLGTTQDNNADMWSKGRGLLGDNHGYAVMTETMVRELLALHAAGMPVRQAARRVGASLGAAYAMFEGKSWRHITGL